MNNKNNKSIVHDDDYEFEKNIAKQEQQLNEAEKIRIKQEEEQRLKSERDEKNAHDKKLAAEHIEYVKLKNGVIKHSDIFKENTEPEERAKLSIWKKLSNFWYRDKFMIVFCSVILFAAIYILIDELNRVNPDLTVMMIANNDLSSKQSELEKFFEQYTDDFNNDGKIKVTVQIIPLDTKDYQSKDANNAKFISNTQMPYDIMAITDSSIDKENMSVFKRDLNKDFPDNKYIDDKGFLLDFAFLADEFNYTDMPDDIHISMRKPIQTSDFSLEKMQKNYNNAFIVFERIVNELTDKASDTNDPGLIYDDNSNTDE